MPFTAKSKKTGDDYYLHASRTPSGGNLFYFSKSVNATKAVDALPEGYELSEAGTGLPILRKKK